jgi:hypothetical protein
MLFRKFKKLEIPDELVSRVQDNVDTAINGLPSVELIQGQLLSNIKLLSGVNIINHGLQRKLIGWFPTRLRGAAQLYDSQDTNVNANLTLILNSNIDVTVDLWVF